MAKRAKKILKGGRKRRGSITILLLLIGFIAGAALVLFVLRYTDLVKPDRKIAVKPPEPQPAPIERAVPEPSTAAPQEEAPPAPAPAVREGKRVKIAIVIDDMGQDLRKTKSLLEINAPITIAILPYSRFSRETANAANSRGWDVLLHLPMEPKDAADNNPGEGALMTRMTVAEVRSQLEADLKSVPHVKGVNNHMGSRFTEDEAGMRAVLETLKDKKLFFLDSKTSSHSVGLRLAGEVGVPNAGRHVFLDNTRDEKYIKGQIRELMKVAKKNGSAIAIGHPYPETIAALKDTVSEMNGNGVEVVRLSDLVVRR